MRHITQHAHEWRDLPLTGRDGTTYQRCQECNQYRYKDAIKQKKQRQKPTKESKFVQLCLWPVQNEMPAPRRILTDADLQFLQNVQCWL